MIKFNEPYKSKKISKYLVDLTSSNNFLSNKYRDKVSQFISEKYKYKYFLLTHSATAAIELSALILRNDLKFKDSTVHLPSYTFSSTANAFLRSNFKINFLDINPENMMVEIKNNNLKNSDIFVPVHYAGSYFEIDKYLKFNNKNITIIEDAAQAFATKYNNKISGSLGRMSCFSFHPTKNIHSGFGGMIVFKYKKDFELAKFMYERGTDRSKVISGQKNKYEWVNIGSSFEMNELSSAVLLGQLEDWDNIYQIKKEIYLTYLFKLEDLIQQQKILIQKIPKNVDHNYHSFYIVSKVSSSILIDYLYKNGVQSYIGYIPLHNSIYGKKLNLNRKLANTEKYHSKLVRLPSHPNLLQKDINKITELLLKYF